MQEAVRRESGSLPATRHQNRSQHRLHIVSNFAMVSTADAYPRYFIPMHVPKKESAPFKPEKRLSLAKVGGLFCRQAYSVSMGLLWV